VLKEHQVGASAADLCRKHGISGAMIKLRYGGLRHASPDFTIDQNQCDVGIQAAMIEQGDNAGLSSSRYRRRIIAASILALGLVQTYGLRYAVASDEGSYLDIARLLSAGDWDAALNGLWSPLYPLLISIGLRLSPHGSPEFLVIQIVNYAIFLFATGAFWWLWRALAPQATAAMDIAVFGICTYSLLRIWKHNIATPDVLVAGAAFIVARIMLYIYQRPEHWRGYLGLATALAFSYFAKAVFFPISVLVLLIVVAAGWRERRKVIPRTAIAAVLFIGIASPLVIGLSVRYQHLTFSEVGRPLADNPHIRRNSSQPALP
jgi:hypothetical protein